MEDNLKWRQQYAPPILAALKAKLKEIKDNEVKYPPKSRMHKAANYFLNEWDGINFFDYLSDVLNKAADLQHLTPEACRNLLPDRWTKE